MSTVLLNHQFKHGCGIVNIGVIPMCILQIIHNKLSRYARMIFNSF